MPQAIGHKALNTDNDTVEITEWDTATVFELLKPTCVGCRCLTCAVLRVAAFERDSERPTIRRTGGESGELVALLEGRALVSVKCRWERRRSRARGSGEHKLVADVKAWIEAMSQGGVAEGRSLSMAP